MIGSATIPTAFSRTKVKKSQRCAKYCTFGNIGFGVKRNGELRKIGMVQEMLSRVSEIPAKCGNTGNL